MAIPTVFAPVKSGDFSLRPITVHKRYNLSSVNLVDTSSGYHIVDAIHQKAPTPIGSNKANNDPTNSYDGSYQATIWKHLDHVYYRNPYDTYATFEHANRRFTYKQLNVSASLMAIPYSDYGEAIKPRSVTITNTTDGYTLYDDGNGNLYDTAIVTSSFSVPHTIVGYWGFNTEFRRFKTHDGLISKGTYKYESRVFEPDEMSGVKNVTYRRGVEDSGMAANFNGDGYIMTSDRDEFNPDSTEEFTIAFWIKAPVSQSNETTQYNSIISKRGVIKNNVYGVNPKYNQSDLPIQATHISSSIEDSMTDIYPYDIELINSSAAAGLVGKVRVRYSNGTTIRTITTSTVVTDGAYHHVAVTISTNGAMLIYVDGSVESGVSGPDRLNIHNKHNIMFGALNRNGDQAFSGSLDEVRIYNTALSTAQIATLADSTSMAMYQTAIVGNVFYRQGNVVISPLQPQYRDAFKNTWTMAYRGTHTIYQYEVLCRVKKGSFNMTYNPTARKSFKSDLLINDMTSSLYPYATTIGLYNSDGVMVAVAKLGQAVQMRDDVDLNFLVRWDA